VKYTDGSREQVKDVLECAFHTAVSRISGDQLAVLLQTGFSGWDRTGAPSGTPRKDHSGDEQLEMG
jgi:hypothetical protein